jgi:hypothetical protein
MIIHRFDDYEIYPLNLPQREFEDHNLHYLYSELEKASTSLFVTESNECSVEILEVAGPSTDSCVAKEKQTRLLVNRISTLDELKNSLQVIELAFKIASI